MLLCLSFCGFTGAVATHGQNTRTLCHSKRQRVYRLKKLSATNKKSTTGNECKQLEPLKQPGKILTDIYHDV